MVPTLILPETLMFPPTSNLSVGTVEPIPRFPGFEIKTIHSLQFQSVGNQSLLPMLDNKWLLCLCFGLRCDAVDQFGGNPAPLETNTSPSSPA